MRETFHYWEDFDPHSLLSSQPFSHASVKGQESDGLKRLVLNVTSQDLLVFCVTEEFNENLFAVFDSDVCLVIKDWEGFSQALVESLPVPVENFLCGRCSYSEKDFFAASHSLPALPFWKEARYGVQKELRLCVSVALDPIAPVTVTCPKAMAFCDVIERRV